MRATEWLIVYIVSALLLFIAGKIVSRFSEDTAFALVISGVLVLVIAGIFCFMVSKAEAW